MLERLSALAKLITHVYFILLFFALSESFQMDNSTNLRGTGKSALELIKNFRKKYKKFTNWSTFKDANIGAIRLRPADFLIDENGIVVDIFQAYEVSEQSHMPFDRIEAFIPPNKRCNCGKKDCISPSCRELFKEGNMQLITN